MSILLKRKSNAPKQKDLNDKNAKRYLVQLGNGNFHISEFLLTFLVFTAIL